MKSLAILRLVAEQADPAARGYWTNNIFTLDSNLSRRELISFLLETYRPTPIVAPWNGGSGFYPKDNREGMDAIASSDAVRFEEYREVIEACRSFPEVLAGKCNEKNDEDKRRAAILRRCRNTLTDRAVEWLDAAIGIDAHGDRSFPPILGTGGNEGRLDYTNNFMSRLAALIIAPDKKTPVSDLLANALFGDRTAGLQPDAAGQYDPGSAGGANQGLGIEGASNTNPWELVLTMEGAVVWASGLYRRQGVGYNSILCSPFTVLSKRLAYGSASKDDDARAEIWAPLWSTPALYSELRALLREGRATVGARPATNTLEFAEAASLLGVDRGIDEFVRYNLLKRRGDSYVALPAGTFTPHYRSNAGLVRKLQGFLDILRDRPKNAARLERNIESAIYSALVEDTSNSMRRLMVAVGQLVRRIATTTDARIPLRALDATEWLTACGFATEVEVRLAAAVASIYAPEIQGISNNLIRAEDGFAWAGIDLAERMIRVLERRNQLLGSSASKAGPASGKCSIQPGDATRFLEGSIDDAVLEDLLFAFLVLDWSKFDHLVSTERVEIIPSYAVLKCCFLGQAIRRDGQDHQIAPDSRIIALLKAGAASDATQATQLAVRRLRIAGLDPLDVEYPAGIDPRRLAAALLIPVWPSPLLKCGILHKPDPVPENE